MDTRDTLIKLGLSAGLGLLAGLQRERKKEELAIVAVAWRIIAVAILSNLIFKYGVVVFWETSN